MDRILFVIILLVSTLFAQQPAPPPFNSTNYIGGNQHSQVAFPLYGKQVANSFAATAAIAPPFGPDPGSERRVKQGNVLAMASYSPYVDDTHPAPFVALQIMGSLPLPLPIVPATLPGSAVGHDQIFSWGTPLVLFPAWVSPIIQMPFAPNNSLWIATMNIPVGFSGYVVSSQWVRWDPTTSLYYLSNEHHTRIST
tara:strand:+ start:13990 stop:14577 length:588 start_codon:yes stop_codon:yes gene_type:complete